jgi:2-dehydropantoate 2-reductase
MSRPVLIWGAGAIGGTIGAFLKRAGHEVVMVDIMPEHVAAISEPGLSISGPIAEFTQSIPAATPDSLEGVYDVVLLAVKGQYTAQAANALQPHLAEDGVVVSVQNGLNEYALSAILGPDRVMGCFINFGSDYLEAGKILYGGRGAVVVGELDGRMSNRLKAIHAMLQDFEPDAKVTDNIFGYLWSKLAFGSVLIAQTLSNLPTEEFLDTREFRPLITRLVSEVARTAHAEGIRLTSFQGFDAAEFVEKNDDKMNAAIDRYAKSRRGSKKLYSGIWRDIVVRKRKTEVAVQGEPVVEAAERRAISVPAYSRAREMIRDVEERRIELGLPLIEELLAIAERAEEADRRLANG